MNLSTLPLPLEETKGHKWTVQSPWSDTQPERSRAGFRAPGAWPARAPASLSLPRSLALAVFFHVLLVLLVGTHQGVGVGGQSRGAAGVQDISITLQNLPAERSSVPDAKTEPSAGDARLDKRVATRPPVARSVSPRPAAPTLTPAPSAQAGQSNRGDLFRGADTGLPAAPQLADLQAPPTAPPPQRTESPAVLAVPAPAAVRRTATPQPESVAPPVPDRRLPADARPAALPALVEADQPSLPRLSETTQGVPDASSKLPAAPALASQPAAPPPSVVAPPVAAPLPAARASAGPPEPAPALARPSLQALQPQTQVAPRESTPQAPVAVPAPPVAVVPVVPPSPRVLPQQRQSLPESLPRVAAPAAVPELPSVPVPSPVLATPPPAAVPAPTGNAAAPAVPAATPAAVAQPESASPRLPNIASPPASVAVPVPLPAAPAAAAGSLDALRGIVNLPPPPPVPAPAPASSAPGGTLNLELPKPGARVPPATERLDPLRLSLPPQEPRSKLSRDIEKSGKEDCRKAYADMGLFGAAAIAADALKKDSRCKW